MKKMKEKKKIKNKKQMGKNNWGKKKEKKKKRKKEKKKKNREKKCNKCFSRWKLMTMIDDYQTINEKKRKLWVVFWDGLLFFDFLALVVM